MQYALLCRSEHWQADPFNLCSNACSTHTSISQTQPLDLMLSTCTQLLWSTMVRPVLSGTCPVKPLYGLGHHYCSSVSGSWQSSYRLCHLYVEQQFFFSDPQRVLCHEVPCWTSSDQYERVRAITANLTHLFPIHTWGLVSLTSHMTPGRENLLLDPIWKFLLRRCSHWQALLINIWQLSAILLLLKLCQVGWGQTHIFRLLQKYLIGFKSRLWLGYSKTFTALLISHSCCVLKVTVLLEAKPSACLRFWMLWTGFSLRLSQYFGALSFSSTLMSPSVPAAEKQPYSMRLLPAHFTFGMVLCRWWTVPFFLQTWCLELRFIRRDNISSHSLRVL